MTGIDVSIQGNKGLTDCSQLKARLMCRKREKKSLTDSFQVLGFHDAKNIFCTGQGCVQHVKQGLITAICRDCIRRHDKSFQIKVRDDIQSLQASI